MVVIARVERLVAGIAQVALRDNPKCSNRREGATAFAVELVGAIALVQHDLALEAARQVEAFEERISWVPLALAPVFVAISRVVVSSRIVDVLTGVIVAIPWIAPSRVIVEHHGLPPAQLRPVQAM